MGFIFQSSFRFTANLSRAESSCIPLAPTHAHTTSLSTSPTRVVHLLQLMNLQGHNIIIQSPQFTLGFTLGVVHSIGLDKCVMAYIHHYNVMQSNFITLEILCAPVYLSLPLIFSLPLILANHQSFYCLYSSVFSKMLYSCNLLILTLLLSNMHLFPMS